MDSTKVFDRGGKGVKGEKGGGDKGGEEAPLVLRRLHSLPRLSSPLSPSFNYSSTER